MKQVRIVLTLVLLLASVSGTRAALAQNPAASRLLQISAFGGVSGVFTGLEGGKNLAVTAGGDIGLPPWRGIRPTLEVRGRYPIDHGNIDSQKNILGGLKVDFLLNHRLRPYGDALFGRGQINYNHGFIYGNYIYALTTTYVDAAGAGFDYQLTDSFAIRVDGQLERWGSAPTPSGNIYSKVGTAALVYYFNFDRRHRR
jgi:hypothetical protein